MISIQCSDVDGIMTSAYSIIDYGISTYSAEIFTS